MLTQCPQCSTVYRILARQLMAAGGQVTCGECATVFNALERLADEPPPVPAPPPVMTEVIAPGIADDTPPVTHANDPALPGDEPPIALRVEMPVDVRRESAAHDDEAFTLDDVPEVLREDVARMHRRRRLGLGGVWTLFALIGALALAMQITWHTRTWWSARYPDLVPHAQAWCAKIGCDLDPASEVKGIELVARDVREHPQYAHALLVNATLANRGAHAIAYPVIQLGMFDRNGALVGVRRFAPTEYLDGSIDIARGMPAGRALYVVLEIADASDDADSFEFTFL
ncbi:MAG: zinc-ribbon and DUF3426 domain-containing protein [Gammaproteobacteria bacterium]